MVAAHTPGPWTVGRMQRSSNFAKDTFSVQGDGTILCRVKGGVTEDAGIAEANARLIAAAPDLLEACLKFRLINARAAREGYLKPEEWGDELFACNAALSAAIAKATGEQPRDQQAAGDKSREEP